MSRAPPWNQARGTERLRAGESAAHVVTKVLPPSYCVGLSAFHSKSSFYDLESNFRTRWDFSNIFDDSRRRTVDEDMFRSKRFCFSSLGWI